MDRFRSPVSRFLGQLRGVMMLRDATEALEVEDYQGAERLFLQSLAADASRTTRLMAYHGAVVARLRLGRYEGALQLAKDASVLLTVEGPPEALGEEDRAASEALDEARRFAEWALSRPHAAQRLREREQRAQASTEQDLEELIDPEVAPLGKSTQWPRSVQASYRLAVHGLMAAGLVAAAADQLASARRLLRAALVAARYDQRIERDVYWHLSRIDEQLGMAREAEADRERYEQLNKRVRHTLRRLRWTN